MIAPTNKKNFYKRYLEGEFGNRPQTWSNYKELLDSNYVGYVTARDLIPGGLCFYKVSTKTIRKTIQENLEVKEIFGQKGDHTNYVFDNPLPFDPKKYRYNESMPDEYIRLQGNVWRDYRGLCLEYSCEKNIEHRPAVRHPYVQQAQLLMAESLLKSSLSPSSYEEIVYIIDNYKASESCSAIVEFSTYSINVGILPYRNTVIWEVRNY
jgi:hypothetical protein